MRPLFFDPPHGATITMLDADKDPHKIRSEGIDAPEKGQPFGTASRIRLGDAISTLLVDRLWIPLWNFSAVHPLRKAARSYVGRNPSRNGWNLMRVKPHLVFARREGNGAEGDAGGGRFRSGCRP